MPPGSLTLRNPAIFFLIVFCSSKSFSWLMCQCPITVYSFSFAYININCYIYHSQPSLYFHHCSQFKFPSYPRHKMNLIVFIVKRLHKNEWYLTHPCFPFSCPTSGTLDCCLLYICPHYLLQRSLDFFFIDMKRNIYIIWVLPGH